MNENCLWKCAESGAKGTGGAMDQSSPGDEGMLGTLSFRRIGTNKAKSDTFFVPNWPVRAWPARLTS